MFGQLAKLSTWDQKIFKNVWRSKSPSSSGIKTIHLCYQVIWVCPLCPQGQTTFRPLSMSRPEQGLGSLVGNLNTGSQIKGLRKKRVSSLSIFNAFKNRFLPYNLQAGITLSTKLLSKPLLKIQLQQTSIDLTPVKGIHM